ncbi:exodeoxyribonuclease VII small subunit [Sulfidibacter corallicola]|uniref:Exodeoxyribonuclease 7 small subunit n=1 Tax=Sulfidibacter corallicola TaxID=2818388 RepID=A0A8A4TVI3_SULCO|nr:exodeoxyribonuclease VII small subunit [Sulfidibacter corallicola]QTD53151.1 exodeoxyribonuclease VII small subunit [Sulfidibacter corallicola]
MTTKKAAKTAKSAEQELSFEAQLAQLEEIVQKLDAVDVPLEEAIACYEQGVKLSLKLHKTLDQAQRKIEILTQAGPEGIETESFDEGDCQA